MTDIIIKKFEPFLGAKPTGPVIGDLRGEFAAGMYKDLEKVLNDNDKKDEYYIIIHSKPARTKIITGGIPIKTTFILVPKERIDDLRMDMETDGKMLGTMCFRVNNKFGKVDMLWCLPLDIPRPLGIVERGPGNKKISEQAKGMPLI